MGSELSATAFLTLDALFEILDHASLSGSRDNYFNRLINGASQAIERKCRRLLASRAYTRVNPVNETDGRTVIIVPEFPVVSVSAIRYATVTDLTSWYDFSAGDWSIDDFGSMSEARTVRIISGATLPEPHKVQITYVGGYGWDSVGEAHDPDLMPDNLQLACALWVAYADKKLQGKLHIAENQSQEGLTRTAVFRKIPVEVEELIAPYVRVA